jgi:cytochrome P450
MVSATSVLHIPGPAPSFLLGWRANMLRFFRDPITYMSEAHRTYGDVVAFAAGGNGNLLATIKGCPGTYFTFGPTCNQAVLSQPQIFQSSPMTSTQLNHGPTTRLLSGIFSMNGDKHKQQRRLMMPAFHKKRIEAYRDDMGTITQRMLDQWTLNTQRNLHEDLMGLTLEIACKTLFGVDVHGSNINIGTMIQTWIKMNLNPAIMLKLDVPGSPYRRFTQASTQLDAEIRRIMHDKREHGSDQNDVLAMLIQMRDENGEQMTEDELIGQANILFFAAHETTANALTWTLFLLAQHPTIYAAVREELASTLKGEAPTVEHMMRLPLMDRVLKESMRVLPPVPFLLRVAMEDTEIDGRFIPANSEIIYSPYITHQNPTLYPDPQRFNPNRWLNIDPSAYEYIPFGAGLRMCIGASFAMMEMKLVLSMMLQRYHLALPADMVVDRSVMITMSPKNGLPVTVYPSEAGRGFTPSRIQGNIRELVHLP